MSDNNEMIASDDNPDALCSWMCILGIVSGLQPTYNII